MILLFLLYSPAPGGPPTMAAAPGLPSETIGHHPATSDPALVVDGLVGAFDQAPSARSDRWQFAWEAAQTPASGLSMAEPPDGSADDVSDGADYWQHFQPFSLPTTEGQIIYQELPAAYVADIGEVPTREPGIAWPVAVVVSGLAVLAAFGLRAHRSLSSTSRTCKKSGLGNL